jgi:hypothetical protein
MEKLGLLLPRLSWTLSQNGTNKKEKVSSSNLGYLLGIKLQDKLVQKLDTSGRYGSEVF